MKETPIFEEVFVSLLRQPAVGFKLLLGGLLSFVPVVNLFAFGYLYRFTLGIRRSGQIVLPEWGDYPGLFADGLRFGVVWLLYWALPVLLAVALGQLLDALQLGVLSYLLLSTVILLASVLFCAALYRLQTRSNYQDLLDFSLILRMSLRAGVEFALPALAMLGVLAWGLPLYGLVFFAGFLIILAHSVLLYLRMERSASV